MHTKIAKFLLSALSLVLLGTLYALVEPYILKSISISINDKTPPYILHFLLLLPTVAAVALIAWASDLQSIIKKLQSEKKEHVNEWPPEITPEERERILSGLNSDKLEIALLKKDLTLHKKYLNRYAPAGFNLDNEEAFEKGWNNADNPPTAVGITASTNKPIFSNNLLWLPDDPNPLCPRCYEADSKPIHMKLKTYLTRPARYYCTRCPFATPHANHPELKSATDEWSSYTPETSRDGFVYFKNTVTPGVFACAVCKGKVQHPMILQPIRNGHTPGSYKCDNCKTWGVLP